MSVGPNIDELEFSYQPKLSVVFFASLMFGAAAVFFTYLASTNQQGLIIVNIIELSAKGATVFLWVLTALSLVMVALAFFSLINCFRHKRFVLVTRESISAPKSGISSKIVCVKFADIQKMSVENIFTTRILTIKHAQGKLAIPNSMIPGLHAFDNLLNAITLRYQENQTAVSA